MFNLAIDIKLRGCGLDAQAFGAAGRVCYGTTLNIVPQPSLKHLVFPPWNVVP